MAYPGTAITESALCLWLYMDTGLEMPDIQAKNELINKEQNKNRTMVSMDIVSSNQFYSCKWHYSRLFLFADRKRFRGVYLCSHT